MSAPAHSQLPDRGTLAEVPIPRLLLGLYRERANGSLVLRRARAEKRILVQNGAPVAIESNLASESLAAQLADSGRISAVQRTQVEARVERKGCKEAAALLSLKLLTPKELFAEIVEHLRRRVVDCFGWPDGEFERRGDAAPGADMQPFRSDPYALVVDGMSAHWSAERMLQELTPRLELYPIPSESFATASRRLAGDPAVDSLLAAVDGKRTFGQALATCFGSPRALATAWLLDVADLVELQDHPESDGPIETEIEIAVVDVAAKPKQAEARGAGPARRDSATSLAEADLMRAEVTEKCQQLDALDYYELLGVSPNDSAAAIKKAYFTAAKRYHPDALARLDLAELKEQAGRVFARIARAYEVLSDANKRANYDAELSGEVPDIDAATLAQAETFFRKGEILVGMGDFKGAIEYLAPAVELWPNECEYQSALGWCFYKKSPPEPETASRHLAEAVRLAPENAVAHFRLGMVLRAVGDSKGADEHLARAKSLDPTVD